jgi:hypothetical protein
VTSIPRLVPEQVRHVVPARSPPRFRGATRPRGSRAHRVTSRPSRLGRAAAGDPLPGSSEEGRGWLAGRPGRFVRRANKYFTLGGRCAGHTGFLSPWNAWAQGYLASTVLARGAPPGSEDAPLAVHPGRGPLCTVRFATEDVPLTVHSARVARAARCKTVPGTPPRERTGGPSLALSRSRSPALPLAGSLPGGRCRVGFQRKHVSGRS